MTPEFEKDSAPTLENYLDSRNIEGLCFDLDNTVFDTDPFYIIPKEQCYLEIAQKFPYPGEDPEYTAQRVSDLVHEEYLKRNAKPLPVRVEYLDGVMKYYKDLYNPEMAEIIDKHFKDFYKKSPELLPHAKELFNYLFNYKNMKLIVGNSLAGREWTDIKIDRMKRECEIDYLPCFTTDIDKPKDWRNALQYMYLEGVKYSNILAIGDSLESDVIPAAEAGIQYIIWIDWRGRAAQNIHKLPDTAEITIVNNLEDIFDLE